MTHADLRKLVALCRELGVLRLKTGDVELVLGPPLRPKVPMREKPAEIITPLKTPTQASANGTPRSDEILFRSGGR